MACSHILDASESGHFVQFHDGDISMLSRNVARFLSEGLRKGEGAIIVATPENIELFLRQIARSGLASEGLIADSRLLLVNAEQALGKFMIYGSPDWNLFQEMVCHALCQVRASGAVRIRAYGEMVGLLWAAGDYTAAMRLEEYWNRVLGDRDLSLFCSYPIDIFKPEFRVSGVDSVLRDHTHLISCSSDKSLDDALDRALTERLGERADSIRQSIEADSRKAWASLPKAENAILWLRRHLPNEAEHVMVLTREYFFAGADLQTQSATDRTK